MIRAAGPVSNPSPCRAADAAEGSKKIMVSERARQAWEGNCCAASGFGQGLSRDKCVAHNMM